MVTPMQEKCILKFEVLKQSKCVSIFKKTKLMKPKSFFVCLISILLISGSFVWLPEGLKTTSSFPDTCLRMKTNPTCLSQNKAKSTTSLQQKEIYGLVFMREEEKLAYDVYSHFATLYSIPVFNNISRSEQVHMDAVLNLLNSYSIPDPASTTAKGEFRNTQLTELYHTLIASGEKDLIAALKAGALIEETDIADLKKHMNETKNTDIIATYTNLLDASYRHLRAFTKNLSFRQVTYAPQVLSPSEYQSIVGN